MKKSELFAAMARVLAALLLILLAIYMYTNNPSTGWFASNEKASGSGMSVQVDSPRLRDPVITLSYSRNGQSHTLPDTWKDAPLPELMPGDVLHVTVAFTVMPGAEASLVECSLTAPEIGADTPVTAGTGADKRYYYLGACMEIQSVNLIQVGSPDAIPNDRPPQANTRLLPHDPFPAAAPLAQAAPIPLGQFSLAANPDQELHLQLHLALLFVNEPGIDQTLLRGNPNVSAGSNGQVQITPSSFLRTLVIDRTNAVK